MSEKSRRADGGSGPPRSTRAVRPGRRILLLAPFPPRVDGAHGGSRAVAQLLVALSARNRVALAYLRAHDEEAIDAELSRRCELVIESVRGGSSSSSVWPLSVRSLRGVLPRLLDGLPLWVAGRWSASFDARVRDLVATWRPEVLQAEYSVMGQYLCPPSADRCTVVTFYEPAAEAAHQRIAEGGPASRFWRLEARRWRRFEAALLERADGVVALTPRDADSLRALGPGRTAIPIDVIPLGVHIPDARGRILDASTAVGSRRLLFVGNFTHTPNVDAARYLVEELFPPLRSRFADLELWIVGEGAPAELRATAGARVTVTGRVPDVGEHLARATIVVAPLRRGGGMRVKVLEAMAAAKPVVATSLAVEGIRITSGHELLVADDAPSFRDAVATLLDDPARREALGRAARDRVAADHSWERTAAAFESLYDRLLAGANREAATSHG